MTLPSTTPEAPANPFILADTEARRIISGDLDATLFVEASAGTGKTTSLVQRVVNLVASGSATLNRIAAITFTEAAAAELRDRVRAGLELASIDAKLSEIERDRCREGITDLDQADICTLHSFAGGLLRERPLEAGLPPGFDTSDEIISGIRFNEEWTDWLDRHLDGETDLGAHLALALTMGISVAHMKTIAEELHENYGDLEGVNFEKVAYPSSQAAGAIVDAMTELERLCSFSKLGDGDVLYDHVQTRLGAIRRLRDVPPGSAASYRLLLRVLPIRQGRGRQGDWNTDPDSGQNACKVLKDLLADLDQQAFAEIAQARQACFMSIIESLRGFATDYARKRRDEGRAEFHDLLVWARELIRDNLEVRDHFRRRYTHLLIDEAQDTDPIQAEIAMLLAESFAEADADGQRAAEWHQIEPEPGKLFVVGDPKQSIYRFRRADVEQMLALQERLERAGGRTVKLTQNFRSQSPVVEWVNRVFELWMADAPDDADGNGSQQASYDAMSPRWQADTESGLGPRVWALSDEVVGERIDPIREREGDEIGNLLRQMAADDEPWQTLDREASETAGREIYRPVRYSDICILIPRRTGLAHLERGLEEWNIPYRLESASLVFETQEIRDLLNCLRAIDNPADQVATVAALRSAAFGCSDADLVRHLDAGGQLDYLVQSGTTGADPARNALAVLNEFHRARVWETPQTLIEGFIRERMLMEAATGERRMREQWRRYRFLVEQAARFTNAGGGPLSAFLGWVDDQINERARVTENPVPESDEDTVRVMTIHGAKGLEFPVVILTGINSGSSPSASAVLFDRSAGRVEVGVGPRDTRFATAGYEELVQLDNRRSAEEQVRLMYVATTRARDHLVLSMRRPERGGKSMAHAIAGYLEDQPHLWEPVQLRPMPRNAPSGPPPAADDESGAADVHSVAAFEAWQSQRKAVLATQGRPSFVAATALSRHVEDDKPEPTTPEPWRRGRAGTSIGRAVHAVLQSIDLATGDDVEHRASAQAVAESVPDREAEIARLVRVALDSDVVGRAVASRRVWREVPVAVPLGDGSLHGFVDLLFEEVDGLVVVDYKTDSVSAADLSDAENRYRLQGGAYAFAIEQITGKPVKEMIFLYLQPNSAKVLPDLRGAIAEAQAAARSLLAAQASGDA